MYVYALIVKCSVRYLTECVESQVLKRESGRLAVFGVLLLAVAIGKHQTALGAREALDGRLVRGHVMLELARGGQHELTDTAAVDAGVLSRHVRREGALRLVEALADVAEARVVELALLLVLEPRDVAGVQPATEAARVLQPRRFLRRRWLRCWLPRAPWWLSGHGSRWDVVMLVRHGADETRQSRLRWRSNRRW